MTGEPPYIEVLAQATAPANWPVTLPFLPHRSARLLEGGGGVGAVWSVSPEVDPRDPAAVAEREVRTDAAAPVTLWRALKGLASLLEAPDDSPAAAELGQLLEELDGAARALGYVPADAPLPSMARWLEPRLYTRDSLSLMVTATRRRDSLSLCAIVPELATPTHGAT